jgi:hypothetical protein
MPWFKVDDSFYDHPKVFDLPDCAVALWVRAGCWSARNLTDGKVPSKLPARLCDEPETAVAELLSRGLWEVDESDRGGYLFRDWTDYQPSAERVKATRAARAEAGSRGGRAKAAKQAASKLPDTGQNTASDTRKQKSAPTRPDPTHKEREGAQDAPPPQRSEKGSRIPEDFWMDEDMIVWGKEHCPLVNGTRETEKFVNHWTAKTGKDATKKDWVRTWKNWMLRAQEYAEENARRRGEDLTRHIDATDARCSKHPRQLAEHCQLCDSEARGGS